MKRIIAILLILILALSLAACGKESAKPDAGSTQNGAANNPPAGGNPPAQTDSPTGAAALTLDQFGSKKGDDPEITLFQVSRIFPLTERAWLGLCPVGDYVKELDADEVDVYYNYPNVREKNDEDYVFEFRLADVEPGNYTMVLCDDDDEGKVVFRLPFTLNANRSFTLDYAKAWVMGMAK